MSQEQQNTMGERLVRVESKLDDHLTVCANNQQLIVARLNRIEKILLAAAGLLLVGSPVVELFTHGAGFK